MRIELAILPLVAAAVACTRPPEGREHRDFERMRQQQRYDPYEPSAFFPNGAVMQAPPAHTVARAADSPWSGAVASLAYLRGNDGAADIAAPPLPIDDRALAVGREQFAITCAVCHGAGGYGGGVMAPNVPGRRPPSLRSPPVSTLPAGTVFKVITDGFGGMPPYGWQMPVNVRWAVVAYMRALTSMPATAETRADSARAAYLTRLDSAKTLLDRLSVSETPLDSVRR